jgi:hypothetical protein
MSLNNLEMDIYGEIMEIYQRNTGVDSTSDPAIYSQLLKLMKYIKQNYGNNPNRLREIIKNAIILILSLFFNKKPDDFDDNEKVSDNERKEIQLILNEVLKATTGAS